VLILRDGKEVFFCVGEKSGGLMGGFLVFLGGRFEQVEFLI